jgi:hypothetical protein
MKTYINGILISVLLLIFTFDFIGQTLTFNHIDLHDSDKPMITQHDQHITLILNEKDSTINFFWDEFKTHYLYNVVSINKSSSTNITYDVSNDYRNIEIVHYKNEGEFLLSLYQETGNVMLHVYNDN